MDLNRGTFIGNLTRDPAIGTNKNGQDYALFTLAVNRKWTNKDGTRGEKVLWLNVACNNKGTIAGAKLLQKGSKAYVEGEVELQIGKDNKGEMRAQVRLNCYSIIVITERNTQSEDNERAMSFNPEEIEREGNKEYSLDDIADY